MLEPSFLVGQALSGLTAAMFLFIVLAMTATIGTVIQQGERPETPIGGPAADV